jgi:hypothetical protein
LDPQILRRVAQINDQNNDPAGNTKKYRAQNSDKTFSDKILSGEDCETLKYRSPKQHALYEFLLKFIEALEKSGPKNFQLPQSIPWSTKKSLKRPLNMPIAALTEIQYLHETKIMGKRRDSDDRKAKCDNGYYRKFSQKGILYPSDS